MSEKERKGDPGEPAGGFMVTLGQSDLQIPGRYPPYRAPLFMPYLPTASPEITPPFCTLSLVEKVHMVGNMRSVQPNLWLVCRRPLSAPPPDIQTGQLVHRNVVPKYPRLLGSVCVVDSSKGFLIFLNNSKYNTRSRRSNNPETQQQVPLPPKARWVVNGTFAIPAISSGLAPGGSRVFKPDADGSEPVPCPWLGSNTLPGGLVT
ncbi:uncharacterized protein LOC123355371 [Mauremys mutica]|uniref:uncharacterized protein LOC123355371 n=1 Tax=Mauremys mutica TaxID=74926 RepID=UPI001D16CB51|nr:uncharacterized protein LOC123355371 [Mauremys mutica]